MADVAELLYVRPVADEEVDTAGDDLSEHVEEADEEDEEDVAAGQEVLQHQRAMYFPFGALLLHVFRIDLFLFVFIVRFF